MKDKKLIEMAKTFIEMLEVDESKNSSDERESKPVEILTIKECVTRFPGLTDYTLRMLIKQGKVKAFRAGLGGRGKFLVNNESLYSYLSGQSEPGNLN